MAVAAILGAAGVCRADLAPSMTAPPAPTAEALASALPIDRSETSLSDGRILDACVPVDDSACGPGVVRLVDLSLSLPTHGLPGHLSPEDLGRLLKDPSPAPAVHTLPPPPSSFSIALSGLATFGAVRLLRQARHIHLGAIPEWYHADAPDRIGSAVRLDLGTDRSLIPVCWYEPIVIAVLTQGPVGHERQADEPPRWQSVYFIPTIAPRSPPAIA